MSRYKIYKHIIQTDAFGIRTKIKKFVKNKRVTKASNNK